MAKDSHRYYVTAAQTKKLPVTAPDDNGVTRPLEREVNGQSVRVLRTVYLPDRVVFWNGSHQEAKYHARGEGRRMMTCPAHVQAPSEREDVFTAPNGMRIVGAELAMRFLRAQGAAA